MVRSQAPLSLTISALAREGDVGVETVRYYQRSGLLALPGRTHGGIRRYGEADLQRLRFIRSAKAAGFTLAQIGELLALDANKDRSRARELSRERIAALDATIAELQQARRSLQRLADQCAHEAEGPCPILRAFERD